MDRVKHVYFDVRDGEIIHPKDASPLYRVTIENNVITAIQVRSAKEGVAVAYNIISVQEHTRMWRVYTWLAQSLARYLFMNRNTPQIPEHPDFYYITFTEDGPSL